MISFDRNPMDLQTSIKCFAKITLTTYDMRLHTISVGSISVQKLTVSLKGRTWTA